MMKTMAAAAVAVVAMTTMIMMIIIIKFNWFIFHRDDLSKHSIKATFYCSIMPLCEGRSDVLMIE